MLFDDDIQEFNLGFFKIPGMDFNNQNRVSDLYSDNEGFMRGNMFKDLYTPYKNYNYLPLKVNSEREKKLYIIMGLCFAITDLNLYLDLHPEDMEAFNMFKKYNQELKTKQAEYETMYGPLEINHESGNKFNWLENPWPWDNERGSMYV